MFPSYILCISIRIARKKCRQEEKSICKRERRIRTIRIPLMFRELTQFSLFLLISTFLHFPSSCYCFSFYFRVCIQKFCMRQARKFACRNQNNNKHELSCFWCTNRICMSFYIPTFMCES